MSTYEPGTVAVATVRGVPNVRVFRRLDHRDTPRWETAGIVGGWMGHADGDVTDVRPLVVLDLTVDEISTLTGFLTGTLESTPQRFLSEVADRIEAQTKPPRIPEPGLWGVVRDDRGFEWVRVGVDQSSQWEWLRTDEGNRAEFRAIVNPTLVRDGIEVAS